MSFNPQSILGSLLGAFSSPEEKKEDRSNTLSYEFSWIWALYHWQARRKLRGDLVQLASSVDEEAEEVKVMSGQEEQREQQ